MKTDSLEPTIENTDIKRDKCDVCTKTQVPDDIFLTGFQDPLNKRVSLLRVCRACLVTNLTLSFRRLIYEQWDV